jgi:hypothetical protein
MSTTLRKRHLAAHMHIVKKKYIRYLKLRIVKVANNNAWDATLIAFSQPAGVKEKDS